MALLLTSMAAASFFWDGLGGYKVGTEVYYTGPTTTAYNITALPSDFHLLMVMDLTKVSFTGSLVRAPLMPPLIHGASMSVSGAATSGSGDTIALKVPTLLDAVVELSTEELSTTPPPPPEGDILKYLAIGYGVILAMVAVLIYYTHFAPGTPSLWPEPDVEEQLAVSPTGHPAPKKASETSPSTPMTKDFVEPGKKVK